LKSDLASQEKPVWDLSVYGPAKEEPNLIVGTDRSFEEDRLKYYLSRVQTGNENQFVSDFILLDLDTTR
jgi:nucleoporin NUP42